MKILHDDNRTLRKQPPCLLIIIASIRDWRDCLHTRIKGYSVQIDHCRLIAYSSNKTYEIYDLGNKESRSLVPTRNSANSIFYSFTSFLLSLTYSPSLTIFKGIKGANRLSSIYYSEIY